MATELLMTMRDIRTEISLSLLFDVRQPAADALEDPWPQGSLPYTIVES
jgi:hypothetical protein